MERALEQLEAGNNVEVYWGYFHSDHLLDVDLAAHKLLSMVQAPVTLKKLRYEKCLPQLPYRKAEELHILG
jgi:hypothetical protein